MPLFFHACAAVLVASVLNADEAIDRDGRRHQGELIQQQEKWSFRSGQQLHAFRDLTRVRFSTAATPLSSALLCTRLLLPGDQHITGTLLELDASNVRFMTSWGKQVVVPRGQVLGVEQPDALLLQSQRRPGTNERTVALTARLAHGRLGIRFHNARTRPSRITPVWSSERLTEAAEWPLAAGMHWLQLDVASAAWRLYIDDRLHDEGKRHPGEDLVGVAFSDEQRIDDVLVWRRAEPLPGPAPVDEQDLLWLAAGEQLFGHVAAADANGVTLEARFGKRAYPWSRVRGAYWRAQRTEAKGDVTVLYRPGPGCSTDRLRVVLKEWRRDRLVVQHELFGEIELDRRGLDSLVIAGD
jgi:hypothetical protein